MIYIPTYPESVRLESLDLAALPVTQMAVEATTLDHGNFDQRFEGECRYRYTTEYPWPDMLDNQTTSHVGPL
ncbi:unnamed protein product [Cyprideis torosa]|uniref:Uncharacterized protein n=1 Tax=Cyprideis torosa TaxID=163714 RepID=A0A7R8WNH5_9CRUS|nr:unnamed protein product [Cyprideis torosa]CAG0904760.1 unnamed protein product [Cyprideis torosa]